MKTRDDGFDSINGEDGGQFVFKADGGVVATPIDPACNLPMVTMFRDASKASEDLELSLYSCVTMENNQNLSPTQKGLLRWHARLRHPSMAIVRWPANRGLLGNWGSKLGLSQSEDPKCATCQYGKQVCRSTGSTHTQQRSETVGGLQHDRLNPGDQVAVDQFEVTKPGRKFHTSGREKDTEKFSGGIIFVDVATGLTKIYFHISTGASEAIASKQHFERFAHSCGVIVRSYRTDSGIFTKEEFLTEIIDNYQTISCSGVGAHHQNGIAKRAVRTHVTKARTILLHAMLRWPEQTSSDLWPMAMQHSEHLVNVIPTMSDGFSPDEKFCRTFKSTPQLQHLPVWGCPTYVLDPRLQDKRKIPKWHSRSRRGQFLGWSPLHASNVALVRNLTTGRISPQFHVVFDNWFETVYCDEGEKAPLVWDVIVTNSQFSANVDPEEIRDYEIDDERLTKEEINDKRARHRELHGPGLPAQSIPVGAQSRQTREDEPGSQRVSQPVNGTRISEPSTSDSPPLDQSPDAADFQINNDAWSDDDGDKRGRSEKTDSPRRESTFERPLSTQTSSASKGAQSTSIAEARKRRQNDGRGRRAPSQRDDKPIVTRRSTRTRNAPERYGYDGTGMAGYMELVDFVRKRSHDQPISAECMVAYWTMLNMDPQTGILEDFEPVYTAMAFKAARRKIRDPDTPNYREAMAGEHREEFIKAMSKEIQALVDKGTWHAVLRSQLPQGAKVIPLTWVFRIKRLPNGEFSKFKARVCVRGDLQEETRETYAPVVRWTTIRSVSTFAVKNKLKTRQIDFENAFVQSALPDDEEVYVECPPGFGHSGNQGNTVLKLKKSLYGMVRAPYPWFHTLKESLNSLGFQSSPNDQCLFINKEKKMIVLVYTDDCLCFAWNDDDLDYLVNGLQGRGHALDEQSITDDVYAYLGIELSMKGDVVEMTQKGLTDKILRTVGMETCNAKETPAKQAPLHSDQQGKPFNENWDMASVVGMLMYLVHTQPDIQFAVHQCAKYTHSPRECHANAVKKICQYLAGTRDRGLCFKSNPTDPQKPLQVDCYVDASFAPLWDVEDPTNPDGAKSRSGYVIRIDNCPIAFSSRKQGETALSTTEAEYMALSMAMRELLWVRRIV